MVKVPEKAPDWKKVVKGDLKSVLKFQNSDPIRLLIEKTDRLYYYWDKIRSQPLPAQYDKEEVWALIRFRRYMNSRPCPVLDVNDRTFTFWLTDDIQKKLHLIEQSAGGTLALWDPDSDKRASAKYIVSSLMEESITSSQIEGAVATIKEAKKMLIDQRKPRNTSEQMIYNNFLTMQSIKGLCKQELSIEMLLELHVSITKDTLESRNEEGRFRTPDDHVWIGTSYDEMLFTPPKAEEIPDRLEKLIKFANEDNDKPFIHPVIKAIILHFWMAYIHPFVDGNGRMARTLFYWYMLRHGYWLFEYTSISKSILKRTSQYANAYLYSEHDDNDLTYFIHFHTEVIMEALEEFRKHIENERVKARQIRSEIAEHPDLNIRQTQILQHVTAHPNDILTIKHHQNVNKISYQTARTDLLELAKKGWLEPIKKGKTFYFKPVDKGLKTRKTTP